MARFDWWVVVPITILISIGLLMLRSVAPTNFIFQVSFVAISIVIFLMFALTDYQLFFSLHLPIYAVSVLFLLLPFVFGEATRGAHRWLQFGEFFLQPSELTKPFFLITFSSLAAGSMRYKQMWLLGTFLLPAVIIFLQPDLGTMMVLAVGWLTVFVSQIPRKLLIPVFAVVVFFMPLAWVLLRDYQKDRLRSFIDPYADPLGRGYQVIQAKLAVGSGQFWGRGLGQGPQSQLKFLPERHTDFMFASLSEELGFVGSAAVLMMFSWLLARIYVSATKARDLPASFFSLAVLAMVAFQVFVNVGMNMGLMPVTGVTLPFVSYGGSSLVSLAVTLGLVISISGRGRV